jgi:hypothetical protein
MLDFSDGRCAERDADGAGEMETSLSARQL